MGSCSRPRADHSSRANFFLQPPIVQCTPLDLTCTERERSAGRMVFLSISHSLVRSLNRFAVRPPALRKIWAQLWLSLQDGSTADLPNRFGQSDGLFLHLTFLNFLKLYVRVRIKSETCGGHYFRVQLSVFTWPFQVRTRQP